MKLFRSVRILICLLAAAALSYADNAANERTFPQSKTHIEKTLKQLQSFLAGRLPVLDGFIVSAEHPFDRFQRGYYQCTVRVAPTAAGGSLVRVTAKITAWYADPNPARSGYQVLPSNGRLENDLLDRLADALATTTQATQKNQPPATSLTSTKNKSAPAAATISAPTPGDTLPIVTAKGAASSGFKSSAAATQDQLASLSTQNAMSDRRIEELTKEAKTFDEILRNQTHPANLLAVKTTGTPVLTNPTEGAKVLFLATAQDEFEILDENANWVHIRISGLSRGWIRRSEVEMPEASTSAAASMPAASAAPAVAKDSNPSKAQPFQVENEQIASFPGTWPSLQGRTVEILTVQASAQASDSQAKLAFARSLLDKEYATLTHSASTAAGIVVIFDSADGGMIAATLPVLQQWKAGTLSDAAFWRRCLLDPPDAFRIAEQ